MAQASTVSVSSVHRIWRSLRFLNAVEAEVPAAKQVHSLVALQAAIKRFVAEANANSKLFCWTKDPDKINAAVRRGHQALDSLH